MSTRSLFGPNKAIERNIDDLLDKVSEMGMLIVSTIHHQLAVGQDEAVEAKIAQVAELKRTRSPEALATLDAAYFGLERTAAVRALAGRRFDRRWQLADALVQDSEAWRPRAALPINQL